MTLEFAEPPPEQARERAPSPLELAQAVRRLAGGEGATRQLDCLACEQRTPHELGPATYGRDGQLLVQWWSCTVCREGRTVG